MKVKVCVVQDYPIFFDKAKTLLKVEELIRKSANEGCQLVVFPESFVPGYPRGFTFGATVGRRTDEGKKLYAEYYRESVAVAGEDLTQLESLAHSFQIYIVLGVTEKNGIDGSLYCSMLYISPHQGLLGVHRKIKPTATERVIWREAGGDSLVSFQTELGRVGGLICWENYMPLARMAMYQQGVEIYVAPTADSRAEWTATMMHIALEGRCFVLGANQYMTKSLLPGRFHSLIAHEPEHFCEGGSVIVSPFGKVLAGPLFGETGMLIAELEMDQIMQSKLDFDVIGHYSRPDIFQFYVKDQSV